MTNEEIASALGITVSAVRTRLYAARKNGWAFPKRYHYTNLERALAAWSLPIPGGSSNRLYKKLRAAGLSREAAVAECLR